MFDKKNIKEILIDVVTSTGKTYKVIAREMNISMSTFLKIMNDASYYDKLRPSLRGRVGNFVRDNYKP